MKNTFIKLRFDRLQNLELSALYDKFCIHIPSFDIIDLKIEKAFKKLLSKKTLRNDLSPKLLKLPYSSDLELLYRERDNLIGALLLNVKALKRANFEELREANILLSNKLLHILNKLIYASISDKDTKIDELLNLLDTQPIMAAAFTELGLERYAITFRKNKLKLNTLKALQQDIKNENPKGATAVSREKLVEEMQLFLRTVDFYTIENSELDYKPLINLLDFLLRDARGQLRNRTTRRTTAKEKLANKIKTDEAPSNIE